MTDRIKLLIVDDHEVIRAGLTSMLEKESEIKIVGEARDGDEAITKTIELRPDIVLMDIFMPKCDGLKSLRKLRNMDENVKVVMMTVSEREEDMLPVLENGASGYLTKSASIDEIVKALKIAATGEVILSPNMATKLVAEFRKKNNEPPLSSREAEILHLLGEGLTNNEIASRLYVGESTVRTYLHRLLSKLNLKNRAEAIAYAARNHHAM